MNGGLEWLVDAFGCAPERLRDSALLNALAQDLIQKLGLTVLGVPQIHRFGGPGGVTGLYLLSESHLAWHTYPESQLATFNLYCCRERGGVGWQPLLESALAASSVTVRQVRRGRRAESSNPGIVSEAGMPAPEAGFP